MAGRRADGVRGAKGSVALGVALLGAALLAGFLGFSSTLNPIDALLGRGAIVTVPDLARRPQPGAEADLRAAGLVAKVRTSYSLNGVRGTVIAQMPAAGSRVREGATVDVVIRRGVNRVEMPDAVGKPLDDVTAPLKDAGVTIDVTRDHSETVAKGLIISQTPGPGVLVTGEDTAHLLVSEGPAQRSVPNVAGLGMDGAAFQLGKAGFAIGTITPADDPKAVVGSIQRTEPAAGTVADRDTVVNLFQVAGPAPVAVPDLTGQSAAAVSAALTPLGLVPNVIYVGTGAGGVTSQDPAPTTMARPGSVVTVEVGAGG